MPEPQVSVNFNEDFIDYLKEKRDDGEIDSVTEAVEYSLGLELYKKGIYPEPEPNESVEKVLHDYSGNIGKEGESIFEFNDSKDEAQDLEPIRILYEKAEEYEDDEIEEVAAYLESKNLEE